MLTKSRSAASEPSPLVELPLVDDEPDVAAAARTVEALRTRRAEAQARVVAARAALAVPAVAIAADVGNLLRDPATAIGDQTHRQAWERASHELRTIEAALKAGEVELQRVRSAVCHQIAARLRPAYLARARRVIHAAVELAESLRDLRGFTSKLDDRGLAWTGVLPPIGIPFHVGDPRDPTSWLAGFLRDQRRAGFLDEDELVELTAKRF